jgi:predicted metal-dependent hydrolase
LNHYLRKLGLIEAGSRRRYAEQAHYIADIKREMLDHLVDEPAWVSFCARLKTASNRLPAFRDELKKVLPDVFEGGSGEGS